MKILMYVNRVHVIHVATILLLWLHGASTSTEDGLVFKFRYGAGSTVSISIVKSYRELKFEYGLRSTQVVRLSKDYMIDRFGQNIEAGHAVSLKINGSATLTEYFYDDDVRKYHKKGLELKLKLRKETIINLTIADSTCLGGWSPYFCPHSQLKYSMEPNWADKYDAQAYPTDAIIQKCVESVNYWKISVRSKYGTLKLPKPGSPINFDVGAIDKFYIKWTNDCRFTPAFHYYVNLHIEFETAHNIYTAYTTVSAKQNEVHELTPRITCKLGSVEPLCTHQVYVIRIQAEKYSYVHKLSTIALKLISDNDIFDLGSARFGWKARLEFQAHIHEVINKVVIKTANAPTSMVVKKLYVYGRDWEDHYKCDSKLTTGRTTTCSRITTDHTHRDQHGYCVLGASCSPTTHYKYYYSVQFLFAPYSRTGLGINLWFSNTDGNFVQGQNTMMMDSYTYQYSGYYGAKFVRVLQKLDKVGLRIYYYPDVYYPLWVVYLEIYVGNKKFRYEKPHGVKVDRIRDRLFHRWETFSLTTVCLSNWKLEDKCPYLRYRIWVEIEDEFKKRQLNHIIINVRFGHGGDDQFVAGNNSMPLFWEGDLINSGFLTAVSIVHVKGPVVTVTRVVINDGRHEFTFHFGVQLHPKSSKTSKKQTATCPPGYRIESDCKLPCNYGSGGMGCHACHCVDPRRCDSKTGRCHNGKCLGRYMNTYCDWTCPPATFGFKCQFYQMNTSNNPLLFDKDYSWRYTPHQKACKEYKDICPYKSCEKSTDGKTCTTSCNDVYKYGGKCERKCHCLGDKPCDRRTGKCEKCAYRYAGDGCQSTCSLGKYLKSGQCTGSCHCADNTKCDVATGECIQTTCATDFRPEPYCQQRCKTGDPTCTKRCQRSNCADMPNGDCDVNRQCPHGCIARHYGNLCTSHCSGGMYMINGDCAGICTCLNNQHECDFNTGNCKACGVRRAGPKCKLTCPLNRYWDNSEKCNRICRCRNSDMCNIKTGACGTDGCRSPEVWSGNDCQTKCAYGKGCKKPCHCYRRATCNKSNGKCVKCDYKYYGADCQKDCPAGRFAETVGNRQYCSGICMCLNNKKCFAATAECEGPCKAGYKGDKCNIACSGTEFGQNCKRRCHCENNDACNPNTGVCPNGCQTRYYKSTCETRCPDGKYTLEKNSRQCLGICECLTTAECVAVDGTCASCPAGRRGNQCKQDCQSGWFGYQCLNPCGHCREGKPCSVTNGICDYGCIPRYYTNLCRDIDTCDPINGEYFYKSDITSPCDRKCFCEQPDQCNVIGGVCMDGKCNKNARKKSDGASVCKEKCPTGKYGENCDKDCTCKLEHDCDTFTGKCKYGCKPLYFGESGNCNKKCQPGKYRAASDKDTCSKECFCQLPHQCYTDGSCETGGCKPGRLGDKCQETCREGRFGIKCNHTCHCAENSTCSADYGRCTPNKCNTRFYGPSCQKTCANNLYVINGRCAGRCYCKISKQCAVTNGICQAGGCRSFRKGPKCDIKCIKTFGPKCTKKCHCIADSACDIDTGKCVAGCQTRYSGPDCQTTCPEGKYFEPPKCTKQCRCENTASCSVTDGICVDQLCISVRYSGLDCQNTCPHGKFQIAGECVGVCQCADASACIIRDGACATGGCIPGKHGQACGFDCPPGKFGRDCAFTCHCKNDDPCDVETGTCAAGCVNGRSGEACQDSVAKRKAANNNIIWIGAGAVAFAICVIACLVGLAFKRKTKQIVFEDEMTEPELLLAMQETPYPMEPGSMVIIDDQDDDLTATESVAPSRRRQRSQSRSHSMSDFDDSRTEEISQMSRSRSAFTDRSDRRKSSHRRHSAKSRDYDDSRATESVTQSNRRRRHSRQDTDTVSVSTAASGRSKKRSRRSRRD